MKDLRLTEGASQGLSKFSADVGSKSIGIFNVKRPDRKHLNNRKETRRTERKEKGTQSRTEQALRESENLNGEFDPGSG